VRVPDVREDPRLHQHYRFGPVELVVSAHGQGQAIGVLDIQSTQVDYITRDQQNVFDVDGQPSATAIENAPLFERVRSQADKLLVLNEVAARRISSLCGGVAAPSRGTRQARYRYQIWNSVYDEAANLYRPPSGCVNTARARRESCELRHTKELLERRSPRNCPFGFPT